MAKEDIKYPIYSDPQHKLIKYLTEQEILKVCITAGPDSQNPTLKSIKYFQPYKNGIAQPAILYLNKEGETIYAWCQQPCKMNLFGAKNRPAPADIWSQIQAYFAEVKNKWIP